VPDYPTRCGYHERERHCTETDTIRIMIDGKPVNLCKRHLKPEFHPEDIRKKLPGKIAQALRGLR
jgi:hypothetical protein